jgi:alpha-tubulin suppressor-like RCC1 family protein
MLSRVAMLAIYLAGCDFAHGVLPPSSDGKLGDGPNVDASPCAAIDIAAGGDHTCAISATGVLYCWGRGNDGQLGVDALTYACQSGSVYCQKTPFVVHNVGITTAIGAGAQHTCSSSGGQAYCWGKNSNQQYGDNSMVTSTTPKPIPQRNGAVAFDGGLGHMCSLAGGMVSCAGLNSEGQIGNMSFVQQGTAVSVMSNVASFSVGNATSCAIDSSRKLFCWGRNTYKTIDGSTTIRTLPTEVAGATDVTQVAVGGDHVCAVFGSGVAKCWGLNNNGQIGNGTTNGTTAQPMTTLGVPNVAEVAASRNHTCVRTVAGDVFCFGEGYTATPTMILTGARKLTAGSLHDCALVGDGAIRCWGDQTFGQLGNNVDVSSRATTPQTAALCP